MRDGIAVATHDDVRLVCVALFFEDFSLQVAADGQLVRLSFPCLCFGLVVGERRGGHLRMQGFAKQGDEVVERNVSRGEEDRTLGTVEPTCKSLCVGSLELPHVVSRAEDVVA